jgi:hypothetical protein
MDSQALPRDGVPQAQGLIQAAREHGQAVARTGDPANLRPVPVQDAPADPAGQVPDRHGPVFASREGRPAIRAQDNTVDRTSVSRQAVQSRPKEHIPDTEASVHLRSHGHSPVGGQGDVQAVGLGDGLRAGARGQVPDAEGVFARD